MKIQRQLICTHISERSSIDGTVERSASFHYAGDRMGPPVFDLPDAPKEIVVGTSIDLTVTT
jgi:hypothetical protein